MRNEAVHPMFRGLLNAMSALPVLQPVTVRPVALTAPEFKIEPCCCCGAAPCESPGACRSRARAEEGIERSVVA